MNNFTYSWATKIVFGKGTISDLKNEIPVGARVLMIYGGGSIKKNGVYEQVVKALEGKSHMEFSGIEPNPLWETCMKAVEVVRENKIDFLLAVGGGSVVDATKFIAAAANYPGDTWNIIADGGSSITKALPIGVVLTLPATGSEGNNGAVISRASTQEKFAFHSPLCLPTFAILDPETTFSLPTKQTANGILDTFAHVMEQYLTYPMRAEVQDRWAESLVSVLIDETPRVFANPLDYDARANLMWTSTLGLNYLISVGVPQDWTAHMIGHEITALTGMDHGTSVGVVMLGVASIMREAKKEKILQLGKRVFGIVDGDENDRIEKTLIKLTQFVKSTGVSVNLKDYGVTSDIIDVIVERMTQRGWKLGERQLVTPDKVREILNSLMH